MGEIYMQGISSENQDKRPDKHVTIRQMRFSGQPNRRGPSVRVQTLDASELLDHRK